MIKCIICENHKQSGNKHNCRKCKTKIVYGVLQEQFIEGCPFFQMIEAEKKRRAYFKKINSLPINDKKTRGKNKCKKYTSAGKITDNADYKADFEVAE